MTPPPVSPPPLFAASLPLQITVGCLCASYWRGAWYVFDYSLFPHDRVKSSLSSLMLGSTLLGMQQFVLSPSYNGTKLLVRLLPPPRNYSLRTYYIKMNRFVNLYMIAISCVLVWRGAWLMWDEVADRVSDMFLVKDDESDNKNSIANANASPNKPLEPIETPYPRKQTQKPHSDFWTTDPEHEHSHNHTEDAVSHHDIDRTLFYSGIASHVVATVGLLFIGRFKSVMAPPANVSMMKDIFLHAKGREFVRAARSFSKSPS